MGKTPLRFTLCLLLLFASGHLLFAWKDRIEQPQTITITYKTGETVELQFEARTLVALSISLAGEKIALPAEILGKIQNLRIETIALLWDGAAYRAEGADYFYLRFRVGSDLLYGDLPTVSLHFRDRHFERAEIEKKVSDTSWQTMPL